MWNNWVSNSHRVFSFPWYSRVVSLLWVYTVFIWILWVDSVSSSCFRHFLFAFMNGTSFLAFANRTLWNFAFHTFFICFGFLYMFLRRTRLRVIASSASPDTINAFSFFRASKFASRSRSAFQAVYICIKLHMRSWLQYLLMHLYIYVIHCIK